ncbi:MAG: hypothetical protein AABY22_29775 [Nanoarchaeota archaeon]
MKHKLEKIKQDEMIPLLDKKVNDLFDLIQKSDSPLDATEYLIFELINKLDVNYYEQIGLLEEVKLTFRDIVKDVMKEEECNHCCNEKLEE